MFKTKTAKLLLWFLTSVMAMAAVIAAVSAYESHSLNVTVKVVQPTCLLLIDEDTIDNNISTIEAKAAEHGETSDWLVNDDSPTETGNPPLRWNEFFPGDLVLLPGGEVQDEGMFTLPPCIEYADDRGPGDYPGVWVEYPDYKAFVQAFIAGTVPKEQLDKILGVKPLRNNDLRSLVGRTCIAVVYDSDISINYEPIYGNLQGARYGLFRFTTLGTQLPGSIPESTSSTSLLDIWVAVEPIPDPLPVPGMPHTPVCSAMEQVPDSVQITEAVVSPDGTTVDVRATSDRQNEGPVLNVSAVSSPIGRLEETFPPRGMNLIAVYYEALDVPVVGFPDPDIRGNTVTVTVSSSLGGSYTVVLLLPP